MKKISQLEKKLLRVLDVNANRSREALRVLEDTARLVWEDKKKFAELRDIRHQIDLLTRDFYQAGVRSRDSQTDAGRTVAEAPRENWQAVIFANFRRAEEALRVLEEYSKVLRPEQRAVWKSLRYAVYTLEKKFQGE